MVELNMTCAVGSILALCLREGVPSVLDVTAQQRDSALCSPIQRVLPECGMPKGAGTNVTFCFSSRAATDMFSSAADGPLRGPSCSLSALSDSARCSDLPCRALSLRNRTAMAGTERATLVQRMPVQRV